MNTTLSVTEADNVMNCSRVHLQAAPDKPFEADESLVGCLLHTRGPEQSIPAGSTLQCVVHMYKHGWCERDLGLKLFL